MDNTPKFKIHSRHRRKNDRKSHGSAARGKASESPRETSRQSKQETPVKTTGSKTIADLHTCYQFIESEPVIVWGSPHVSPSYELRVKQARTSTPRHRLKDEERFPKPVRKLIKGTNSPSQFLRDLVDFSEQFKSDKVKSKDEPEPLADYSCSTEEVPLSVEISGCALSDSDKLLPTSPKYRPCPEEMEQIKKDSFQALFDDGDDDIMLKCSQEIEEIITKVTFADSTTSSSSEEAVIPVLPPEPKGGKPRGKKQATELTPKSKRQTKRVCGSSSKREGRNTVNQSPRNKAFPQGRSETRKSPRFRGGAVRVREEAEDFGRESFEDILNMLLDNDFSDVPGGPPTSSSETACGQKVDAVEGGRRKGTPRSARANARRSGAGAGPPTKSENLQYFGCEGEDLNDSDLVKALDVVESQTIQSSPQFRCTPDEILQKKLEAKRRLAKKKLSRHKGTANVFSMSLKPKR